MIKLDCIEAISLWMDEGDRRLPRHQAGRYEADTASEIDAD